MLGEVGAGGALSSLGGGAEEESIFYGISHSGELKPLLSMGS